MNQNKLFAAIAAVLASALALDAHSGTLEPELEAAIADLRPNDKVDVIIRCTDSVDPNAIVAADVKTKKTKLIEELSEKSKLCTKLIEKDRAINATENETELWLINAVAATVKVSKLKNMAKTKGVERIGLNAKVVLPEDPPAPQPAGQPGNPGYTFWNLSETRITDLWALGYYGQDVVVGTLDTGVDLAHADVGPNWRGGSNSWFDPHGEHALPHDADGHGTEVMGIILGGNSLGVDIGAAPGAQWIAVKVFDDSGESDLAKIHQAYQWMLDPDGDPATDDAPAVVNNSWALPATGACTGEFAEDIAILNAADIAMVFSAGNYGPYAGSSVEPANNPGSLSVGAVDFYGDVLYTSSRGPSACGGGTFPNLVAPGKDVFTTGLTGGGTNPSAWAYITGTSAAAPHVAGALAVLKGAVPDATFAEVQGAIQGGALDRGAAGPDNDSGAGYLDAVEAYYVLADGGPTDADSDGVTDDLDQCPGTPLGETVDALGCASSQLDEDGDGVSDTLDLCLGTPAGEPVDASGCSTSQLDADSDGVTDDIDHCPGTPPGETVDSFGCAASQLDEDGDGVADTLDLCLGTPAGEPVDADGCSASQLDADSDGVTDDIDQCPGTPPGETVDSFGCAASQLDEDGDGVADTLDLCLGTPAGEPVDADGCSASQLDTDADGVSDALDLCPATPAGETVDADGCSPSQGNPGNRGLFFSTLGNSEVPDVAAPYNNADIYGFDGEAYSRLLAFRQTMGFNASVDALDIVDEDTFYVSFANTTVSRSVDFAAFGGTAYDEDVLLYDQGNWSLYFDGSVCGLDASNGQDIDAISIDNGTLYFSTLGGGNTNPVGGVPAPYDDADVYTWAEGAESCGRALDVNRPGPDLLPPNADIDGLTVRDGTYYMSFDAGVDVPILGIVQDEAVVSYDGASWALYFSGPGLDASNGQDVDAFDLP